MPTLSAVCAKIKLLLRQVKYVLPIIANTQSTSIGRKLLLSVLCISSIFVLVQTSLQLKWDYEEGIERIDNIFTQIELGYKDSLTKSLWEMHREQIKSSALGIQQMPNVVRVEIDESVRDTNSGNYKSNTIAKVGNTPADDFITRDIPIYHEAEIVGNIKVYVSLKRLYNDLLDQFLFVIFFQSVKTLLVSVFILATFNFLVTRHLSLMAKFSLATNLDNLDEMLELDRQSSNVNDELTLMVNALNETKVNLKRLFKSDQVALKLQTELEQKVEKEALQKSYQDEIERKNQTLKVQNDKLETTIDTLQETQQKLVTSEKMAALGGMVKGVAHELNTPIGLSITGVSHIQSQTDTLIHKLANNAMKKSDLDAFLESCMEVTRSISLSLNNAASLIKSFKLVSVEQHEDQISHFNLRENLDDILVSINHSLKDKHISIINSIPKEFSAESYPGIYYQIYSNLINNSLLHAFENMASGEINISAKLTSCDEIELKYSDNGCGMNEETVERIFEPFFTTKRANGGTGLGMNILYTLVTEKLMGEIKIESTVNQGSIFTMNLPLNNNDGDSENRVIEHQI